MAHGLHDAGFGRGSRVAIWAPNSPVWVVAALAVLAAGGVVVSIDDLADAEQFEAALTSAAVRLIFTTAHHLEASGDILRGHAARVILVDEPERAGQSARGWLSVLGERTDDLPIPGLDQPALLSWTSGEALQGRKAEQRIGRAGNDGRRPERSGVASRTGDS